MNEIADIVDIILNNGVAIGCMLYFMWINNTTMKEMKKSFDDLAKVVDSLKTFIEEIHKGR